MMETIREHMEKSKKQIVVLCWLSHLQACPKLNFCQEMFDIETDECVSVDVETLQGKRRKLNTK